MNIPNPFKHKPTLEELQRKNEYADEELSLSRKKALMAELEARAGKYKWQEMSDNGKKSGINFSRIIAWLKTN